jgi:UDP-N-acetylglucosamine 3-dehydrogenase
MLNISVIGCGFWGRNHARVFSELSDINLKYVVDIDELNAKYVSKKFNVEYKIEPDLIFQDPDIDAVTICTPTVTHADLALQAIQAGKHVLVEKPMTDTVKEAENLIQAAKLHGVYLVVGFIERFNPAVIEARRMIQKNQIGDVILVHAKRVSRWPQRIGDVGVIKDLSIHDIDLINTLFDSEPNMVFATAGSIQHSYEDYANIMISFPDKRGGFVETNWLTPRKVRNLTITGTDGIIEVEYIDQTVKIENQDFILQPFIDNAEPLKLELESFVNSITKGVTPEVTGEDGLKALKICEAAIESSKSGRPVVI